MKRKISLMCDVDKEAVVTAADAPSIYDIPKVLHSEGLDAYVVRRLEPAVPRRRLDRVGRPAAPACTTRPRRSPSRWSASTSTCPTPTSRSPRRCAPAASPTRPRCKLRLGALRRVRRPGRARRGTSPTSTRSACPAASAIRGIEGKVGALQLRPHARHPHARAVPGAAVHGHRVRPATWPASRGPTPPSSTRTARSRSSPRWPSRSSSSRARGDLGGTMRLGLYPAELREGSVVREAYGEAQVEERHRHRYEVNNALPRPARGGRAGVLRHLAGQQPGRVRRAAPRRAPLLRRHPGAPRAALAADPAAPAVRRAWSRPRSRGRRSCGSRSTSRRCVAATRTSDADHMEPVERPAQSPV